MLFDRLLGEGTGHSRGPSDGAKLQLPGLAKPVLSLTPLDAPMTLATPNFSEHTVSIRYSPVLSSLIPTRR